MPRHPASPAEPDIGALGWIASPPPPARSSVEVVRTASWAAARLWTTPASFDAQPLELGMYRIILGIDGEASVHVGAALQRLRPRQLIVLDGTRPVSTRNDVLWARTEWHLRAPLLRHPQFEEHMSTPISLDDSFTQLIATTTNVISTHEDISLGPGSPYLLDGLAGMIAAAIIDSTGSPTTLTPAQASVYLDAMQQIHTQYGDHGLSAERIAQDLSVSRVYLHRVFALAGKTPRQEIEDRRAEAALSLLDANPNRGKGVLDQIAVHTGFTSSRQMRIALARHRQRYPPVDESPPR